MFDAIKHSLQKKITWNNQDKKPSTAKKGRPQKPAAQADLKAAISRPQPHFLAVDPYESHVVHSFLSSTPSLLSGPPSGSSSGVQTPDGSRTPNGPRPRPQGFYGAQGVYSSEHVVTPLSPLPPPRPVPKTHTAPASAAPDGAQSSAQRFSTRHRLAQSGTFGEVKNDADAVTASPSMQSMSSTDSYRNLDVTTHAAERLHVKHRIAAVYRVPGTVAESEPADLDAASTHSIDTTSSFGDVLPRRR